jgi:hypothetical protein
MKRIDFDEDITTWLDLPGHSNVATGFDQIIIDEDDKSFKFALSESSNERMMGNMYKYIKSLNLNLGINIPVNYIEMIYDCII